MRRRVMKSFIELTQRFQRTIDVEALLDDLSRLKGDEWLYHYDPTLSSDYVALILYSVDGRDDGPEAQRHLPLSEYSRYRPTKLLERLPSFAGLLDDFRCAKGRVRISKLGPHASIGEHRDVRYEAAGYPFGQIRLHIPLKTNPEVYFWIDRKRCVMDVGHLYYGDFTKRHWVENRSDEVRVHLVIDLMLNDWLAALFPPPNPLEQLSIRCARTVTPLYWEWLKRRNAMNLALYKAYQRSFLHSVYQRLK